MTGISITRRCTICSESFPATSEYFYRNKNQAGGLKYECKPCARAAVAEYRKANKEKIKQSESDYKDTNRERVQAYNQEYYARNPEHHRQRSTKWRIEHPERRAEQENNRRALKRGAEGAHTPQDIEQLKRGQNNRCWYCGADLSDGYHIDHFVPLSKGGANQPGNLRLACPTCNLKKSNKDPHLWSGRLL